MVANPAGGEFVAVAGDVVLEGLDGQRILARERFKAALRHRERIVREVELLLLLVPLEHRKIDDPAELEPAFVDELELLPDFRAREAGEFGEFFRIAGDEKRRVARFEAERRPDRLGALRADVVGERPTRAHTRRVWVSRERRLVLGAVEEQDIAEPRLAFALRPGIHPVGEGALAAAGSRNAPRLRSSRSQAGARTA